MAAQKPWAVFVYMVADDEIGSAAKVLDDVAEGELDLMFGAVDRSKVAPGGAGRFPQQSRGSGAI